MRSRAKIAEEIAALAVEVSELMRRRGAGLPDGQTLAEFIVAAFGYERARDLAEAADFRGVATIGEAVSKLQIAPGAETLRSSVVTAFQAVDRRDLPAFKRASQSLREALLALLEARAGKWRQLDGARRFYRPCWQSALDPAEHVRAAVPKLTRWEVLAWAGQALRCAVDDVWLWRLWQTGEREHQEDSRRRGQIGMSEEAWQREIAQHTLPEAEALIVDSWPVPPDAEWPEGNIKFSLSRLREWQVKQGGVDAVSDQITSDQERQR